MTKSTTVTAGFIPLADAATLIVARERGYAEAEGLDLHLVRETSWANIRDRVAIGHFAAAHMLAPMALAGSLGLPPLPVPIVAPLALGSGRNGITVSNALWARIVAHGPPRSDARSAVEALARVVKARRSDPTIFAVVHPYSAHAYLLRYWLAAGGLRPDKDIVFEVVPPPYMADALRSGRIDGFCVGEPWNSVAEAQEVGRILTHSGAIWPRGPDKILGLRADWVREHEEEVGALIRALYRAAVWCDAPGNVEVLAEILAAPDYLRMDVRHLLPGLGGAFVTRDEDTQDAGYAATEVTFPWRSHAVWFLAQMARWGQAPLNEATVACARETYRPDLYRSALIGLGVPLPLHDDREEVGANGFFDGRSFDARNVVAYLAADR